MPTSNICRWQDKFPGEPSEAFIRSLFVSSGNYRISKRSYKVGTATPGSMRQGTVFVLLGSCYYRFETTDFHLKEGEFTEFPEGGYNFSVEGDSPVVLVYVWELPVEFRSEK